jgi:crotonobetainyl-CoA:carnitine CoA-transferase CaiB-like acyl-CoA transferase
VVVENFSPRVMGKLGLDYDNLVKVRPDIIMVSLPGFGKAGPHSDFVSFGGPLMAYTGMSRLWGYADSPPDARVKVAQPDYISSTTQALAVIAALHHRARTGCGQFIEIAQVETAVATMELAFLDYFANGVVAEPRGNRDPNAVPQGCYPCLGYEAWCVISCETDAQWQALARLMDDASLANDPDLATKAGRWAQHDALDKRLSDWTAEWRPYQLMRALQAVGVPAGMVQTAEDLWRDPHLRARHFTVQIEHADDTLGVVEHPGMTVKLHATPGQIQRRVGPLGEANDAVFRGLLGLTPAEIVRLAEVGVIA